MTKEGILELGSVEWLSALLAEFDCQTGTLHRADGEWLDLVVAQGVPEPLMPWNGFSWKSTARPSFAASLFLCLFRLALCAAAGLMF